MQITIREPGSAITHFIAMMMAVFAAVPLFQGQHDPVIRCQRHLSFRGPHR